MKRIGLLLVAGFLVMPFAYANTVIGEWEVVDQSPSQKELMVLSMKAMGMSNVNPDNVTISESSQVLTIAENSLKWETVGGGISGSNELSCKINPDKVEVIFNNVPDADLSRQIKQFTPQYYFFKFEDERLILTTSEIPGYGNGTITYTLKRKK